MKNIYKQINKSIAIAAVSVMALIVVPQTANAEYFIVSPSYDYDYASPSYGYDFSSPSYSYDYSSPSYNYGYSSPSYSYDYSSPSYDYNYSSPSYSYDYSYPSYNYDYSSPSYSYDYSSPSYNYDYSSPSYSYDYSSPSYNYDYTSPSYNYDYTSPSYNYDYSSPSYSYDYTSPSYDYDYVSPSYNYDYASPSYSYDYSSPSYDYDYASPSYNYDYVSPSYDYDYVSPSYTYDYASPSYDYDYVAPSYDYDYAAPSYNYDYARGGQYSYDAPVEYAYYYDDTYYYYQDSYPNYGSGGYVADYYTPGGCSGSRCDDYNPPRCTGRDCDRDRYDDLEVICVGTPRNADEGDRITWRATATGGYGSYDYDWSGDDGLNGDDRTITKRYNSEGRKDARVVVEDRDGNRAIARCSVDIDDERVDDDFDVICRASDTRIEEGDRVTFTADVDGGNSPFDYDWDGDNGVSGDDRTETFRFNREGRYEVTVRVTDDDGRTRTDECPVIVVDDEDERDDFDVICIASDTRIDRGDRVTFTADVDGGDSPYDYDWSGDIRGDERRETVRFNQEGTYRIRLTVEDDDGNRGSDTCTVRVGDDDGGFVQSSFTGPSGNLASVNSVFLNQVPTTGADDVVKTMIYATALILWSIAVAVALNKNRQKKMNSRRIEAFKRENLANKQSA